MGMFDDVICRATLPGEPPAFVLKEDSRFQTKDLDCTLTTYEVTEDGRLVELPARQDMEHNGDLNFYTSNICGSGPGLYTENGEDAESVDYTARFYAGQLVEIIENAHERKPALPTSKMRKLELPSDEDVVLIKQREAESLIGRKLFLLWGGREPDEGYEVEVVAEGDKHWCVKNQDGELETLHRAFRDSLLFDTKEDAAAYHAERMRQWQAEKAEYQALVDKRTEVTTE